MTTAACSSSAHPPALGSSLDGGVASRDDGGSDGSVNGDGGGTIDSDATTPAGEAGPVRPAHPAAAISMGTHHTCALLESGAVRCWGDNSQGQLGDGTTTQRTTPVDVIGLPPGITAIAAGDFHTCALSDAGVVSCWGSNASGALGDGSDAGARAIPGPVSLQAAAVALGAGGADTCASMAAGAMYCWGLNASGQLGDGTQLPRPMPSVPATGVLGGVMPGPATIAPGGDHTCVVANSGAVLCAGVDTDGALGNGENTTTTSYVANGLSDPALALASSPDVSCALTVFGQVFCWGFGGAGETGIGSMDPQNMPQLLTPLAGVVALAGGIRHACAVSGADGGADSVYCWGDNSSGAFGNGTRVSQGTPVPSVGLPASLVGVAAGTGTCALAADGSVYCWGANTNGEVGDGTTTERDKPVAVVGL